jgi:type IV pilus assembly protein PilN
VILVNLLPHREAARKRRKELFQITLVAAMVAGVLVSAAIYVVYDAEITHQQASNHFLESEIKRLDAQIADVATLQDEIAALRARQQAVENLQADRNLPVHLLNELVRQLPNGVYVTSLKQENQTVTIQGMAQSNERVSELLRNLANNSPWLERPDLIEIVAATVALTPKDQRRVASYTVRVRLRRGSETAPVAVAAASAASGATTSASSAASAAVGKR